MYIVYIIHYVMLFRYIEFILIIKYPKYCIFNCRLASKTPGKLQGLNLNIKKTKSSRA